MIKRISLLLGFTFILLLAGCKQEEIQETDINSIELELSQSTFQDLNISRHSNLTNKRICVIFGYDFNSPEITEQFISLLSDKYGLEEDNGLIYPIVYPNDFKHGPKGYVSDLTNLLQDDERDLAGVIILGAPENTHIALARNQDKWNQAVPYPIIALFPQDEVLGLESTCDIVLDKGQTAELAGEISNEEIEVQLIAEAPEVLTETIDYIQKLSFSLSRNSSIQTHLLQLLKGRKVHHYTDPETGLQSINHFVLN